MQLAILRVFNRPAVELVLRVHREEVLIVTWAERQIFRAVRCQELLHGLGEVRGVLVDGEREFLFTRSLVVDVELVSETLTGNKLTEGDDFLLDADELIDA